MKNMLLYALRIFAIALLFASLSSCDELLEELQKDPTPTKNLMLGVWEVTEAYDLETNKDITDKIKVLFTGFHLTSDNGVNSTAGPMVTYLVYGPKEWTQITSKLSQVFDYAKAVVSDEVNLNTGEFFIGSGVQERFTLEMKLQGIAGSSTIDDILSLLGVENHHLSHNYFSKVIYHRFRNVRVEISELQKDMMVWTFDGVTDTYYFTKDDSGDNHPWGGYTFAFRECRFVLQKKSKSLINIVSEMSQTEEK